LALIAGTFLDRGVRARTYGEQAGRRYAATSLTEICAALCRNS
jgi:hypothetical protein